MHKQHTLIDLAMRCQIDSANGLQDFQGPSAPMKVGTIGGACVASSKETPWSAVVALEPGEVIGVACRIPKHLVCRCTALWTPHTVSAIAHSTIPVCAMRYKAQSYIIPVCVMQYEAQSMSAMGGKHIADLAHLAFPVFIFATEN